MSLVDANVTVPSLTRFVNKVDGEIVRNEPIQAPVPAPTTKYYMCTHPAASFHRKDGTRLSFVHGYFKTSLLPDQRYLDDEIDNGNSYLSHATEDQVKAIQMKEDPRKTIEDELRPKMEAELREKLSAEIRAELLAGGADLAKMSTVDLQRSGGQVSGNGVTITPMTLGTSMLKPVSTADIAQGAVGSGGGN